VGVLNVRKPPAWTSHDVVARLRRLAGQRRVGHAGTLDPMAVGVLPVLLGRATRLADYVGDGRKVYLATARLGVATNTDDADGEVIDSKPVPPLAEQALEAALDHFRGPIQLVPPAFSAVKVQGRRADAIARAGGAPDLPAWTVTVHRLDLRDWTADTLTLEVECSRGTYIRSLARDLAVELGTLGHLTQLVRTRVGSFTLEDALTPEQIGERGIAACLLPPDAALTDVPAISATTADLQSLGHGRVVPAPDLKAGLVRVYDPSGARLLFLGEARDGHLKARLTLYPGADLTA
jgi:tRNA pseudouridine55 synthase